DAMGGRPARVNDALRDALVVEVRDLFPKNEVLERRTADATLQGAAVVADSHALIGGDRLGTGAFGRDGAQFGGRLAAGAGLLRLGGGLAGPDLCHWRTPGRSSGVGHTTTRRPGARLLC